MERDYEKKRKTDDASTLMGIIHSPAFKLIVGAFIVGFSLNAYTSSAFVTKAEYEKDKEYNFNRLMLQGAENRIQVLELKQAFFISKLGDKLTREQETELAKIKSELTEANLQRIEIEKKSITTRGK